MCVMANSCVFTVFASKSGGVERAVALTSWRESGQKKFTQRTYLVLSYRTISHTAEELKRPYINHISDVTPSNV